MREWAVLANSVFFTQNSDFEYCGSRKKQCTMAMSLKFSANGRSVYNPAAQSAWLVVDETRIVEVPGGLYVNLDETASKNP